jgi:hypothetical protein
MSVTYFKSGAEAEGSDVNSIGKWQLTIVSKTAALEEQMNINAYYAGTSAEVIYCQQRHLSYQNVLCVNKQANSPRMSNPTLTWERLGSKFYRNFKGFELQWDIELEDYIVASAPYGGAIALTKDKDRIRTRSVDSKMAALKICSGSGKDIKELPWDGGRIAGIGLTTREDLLVVSESGAIRCYYSFEGNFMQFTMGRAAEADKVLECKFHGDELVALLGNGEFIAMTRYGQDSPQFRPLAKMPDGKVVDDIDSWTIVPPNPDMGQNLEAIVSVGGNFVVLSQYEAVCDRFDEFFKAISVGQNVANGGTENGTAKSLAFEILTVSPSGNWVGAWRNDGTVFAFARDMGDGRIVKAIHTGKPNQLAWCGEDALALVENDTVTLLDVELGKTLELYFDARVQLFSEVDGMRTLTCDRHDFFTRVPQSVVDIFRLGSTSPAAILLDSVEQLERKSPKADENLQLIANELATAVDACVEAAGLEFEPRAQKTLLRAAAFGKFAIPVYNSDRYIRMSDALRVLNTVRLFDVGMLVSYPQFSSRLGPNSLIDRLLKRRMHALAFECGQYLDIPGSHERVLVDWACTKIRLDQSNEDATLFRAIMAKTSNKLGVEYDRIAATAFEEGRPDLAVVLINEELRADRQIPLLLSMNENELAIAEAGRSCDTNLMYYVLIVLMRKLPRAAFYRLINDQPLASRCYIRLCRALESVGFNEDDFYYQDDRREDIATSRYARIIASPPDSEAELIDSLGEAKTLFRQAKTLGFEEHAVEEQIRLVRLHLDLERDYGHSFRGKTITETISVLLAMTAISRATKVKDEFKVSDAKFWWLRIQALVARRDWDALHKLATSKKSPIGYEPFYSEALRFGNKQNAALYVSLCTNLPMERRLQMYIDVGDLRRAIEEARKYRDVNGLKWLKQHATEAQQMDIENIIASLGK